MTLAKRRGQSVVDQDDLFAFIFGLLVFVFLISKLSSKRQDFQFARLTVYLAGFTILSFTFYSGPLPIYYFLFLFSVFLIASAQAINEVLLLKSSSIVFLVLTFYFIYLNLTSLGWDRSDYSLENKRRAVKYIINEAAGKPFEVNFVSELGLNTGFQYLFWLEGKPLIKAGQIANSNYKIILPYTLARPEEKLVKFGGIGVEKN